MRPNPLHRFIVRLMLAWFALALGVAAASPLVQPRAMQLVCSAQGAVKLLVESGDGMVEAGAHTLDCALCLLAAAPPPNGKPAPAPVHPSRGLPASAYVDVLSRPAGAPLPARGPPAFS